MATVDLSALDPAADPLPVLRELLAPLGEAVEAERLTGGMFATTFRVTLADGERVIVKTAPTSTDRLLTYEADLIRTEALVYGLAADRPDLLMPRVLHTDFTRQIVASDVVVASHLPGTPLMSAGFGPSGEDPRTDRADRELGALMARLHTVIGDRFGYPNTATGLQGDTWVEAFGRIVEQLLADAAQWGTVVPDAEVRAALARHADALAQVDRPALLHTDLWPGNLFVDVETGELVGVIDTERAFWGDPLLELSGADQTGRGPVPTALLAGYAEAASAFDLDEPTTAARLLLYRMFYSLLLVVEIAPRGYVGDWLPQHRATAEANLRWALDELAALDAPANA
ncbi:phosphotransferase family protein [Cellulomonas soli]